MRAPLLLVAFSLAFADAAPSPIPVTLTIYATPRERDFGSAPAERIRWKSPLDGRFHWSLFVAGFADRDSSDPRLPDIAGAAMEGSGEIEPAYHRSDRALSAALAAGYRFLILDQWKARRRLAVFSLAKTPLASDERPLRAGLSAAVRDGNSLFPLGRTVRLTCRNHSLGVRLIHDECSSCAGDHHIDLYVAASTGPTVSLEDCTAVLLPK